jgi:hypothetical protein
MDIYTDYVVIFSISIGVSRKNAAIHQRFEFDKPSKVDYIPCIISTAKVGAILLGLRVTG